MNVKTKRNGDVLISSIHGEIDHHIASELSRILDMEIVSSGINVLILDMSGVSFMDSSGIGVIMGRKKNMELLGGKLCVAGMKRSTRRLMEVTGFKGVIEFYDCVNSAIHNLSKKVV